MELSWKPVRKGKGKIYCSAACGYNCLHRDYLKACRGANALCKKLGSGWRPTVWENGGWHWKVSNGDVVVSERTYAYDKKYYEAHYDNEFHVQADEPNLAVNKLHIAYTKKQAKLDSIVSHIRQLINQE